MNNGHGKWRLKGRGRRYGVPIPFTIEIGKVEHRVVFIDDLCDRFNTPGTEMVRHERYEFDGKLMARMI